MFPYSKDFAFHFEGMCPDCSGECEIEDLISLLSLTAALGNRRVTDDWKTASEIDNAEFNPDFAVGVVARRSKP